MHWSICFCLSTSLEAASMWPAQLCCAWVCWLCCFCVVSIDQTKDQEKASPCVLAQEPCCYLMYVHFLLFIPLKHVCFTHKWWPAVCCRSNFLRVCASLLFSSLLSIPLMFVLCFTWLRSMLYVLYWKQVPAFFRRGLVSAWCMCILFSNTFVLCFNQKWHPLMTCSLYWKSKSYVVLLHNVSLLLSSGKYFVLVQYYCAKIA